MSRLKELFEELGFDDVGTFIASGNVLFSSKVTDTRALESQIAGHLETALGYDVDTFVRTAKEVAAIGGAKIFSEDGNKGITIPRRTSSAKTPRRNRKKTRRRAHRQRRVSASPAGSITGSAALSPTNRKSGRCRKSRR